MKLKCYHKECEYSWDYNGNSPFYATCPNCMKKISIKKAIRLMGDSKEKSQ